MNALNALSSSAFFKPEWLSHTVGGLESFAGFLRASRTLGALLLILIGAGVNAEAQARTIEPLNNNSIVGADAYGLFGSTMLTNCMKFSTISGRRAESGDLYSEVEGLVPSKVHGSVHDLKTVRLHHSEGVPVMFERSWMMFVC